MQNGKHGAELLDEERLNHKTTLRKDYPGVCYIFEKRKAGQLLYAVCAIRHHRAALPDS
ncbi:MAG: hypothetical protein IBX69_11080 [Anaerolineales bacterium]|nr:hypothetical protein [Anaerolineales bacterium]